MITNQQFHSLKIIPLIYLLFFNLSSFGQEFEITGFVVNGTSELKAKIKYLLPDADNVIEEEVNAGKKFPFQTLLTAPKSTEIIVLSSKGYKIKVSPGTKLFLDNDKMGEDTRVVKGKVTVAKESIWDKFKSKVKSAFDFFGGPSDEIQAAVEGTEFTVEIVDDNLKIDLTTGKVAINKRISIKLNEKFMEQDNVPKRELFLTETTDQLDIKNRLYDKKSDSITEKTYETEAEIEKFFKNQLGLQKRILTNGGEISRSAYKLLEKGQDSLGIVKYQEAMEHGEINRNQFIQASLIITEAYYRNGDLKNRMVWLNGALHFIKLEHDKNETRYRHFKKAGEEEARIGFGQDLVISKKYYAWAYTVKLKLTGCLESSNQNPTKWLGEAKEISDSF